MNKYIALSRPTRVLIVANAVLALVVSAELLLPTQPGTASAAAADGIEATLPQFGDTTLAAVPMNQFANMMERPVFYPDRQMPQPEVEQSQGIAITPLTLKLEGIAIAGGSRVAVLRNLNGNALVQLAEGDMHDGWTLDALTSTSATFSRNGEQATELLLDPASNGRRR